ncbi:hypothetical protein UPYG_G00083210 [Umbra pygmaea]|uniref:Uncharacterized protein n=1 Tax=Umbra pygmaea TaxID=75934 RepID=A0ABD0XHI0_UMBPY
MLFHDKRSFLLRSWQDSVQPEPSAVSGSVTELRRSRKWLCFHSPGQRRVHEESKVKRNSKEPGEVK